MGFFSKLSLKYKLLVGLVPIVLFTMGFSLYLNSLNSRTEESFKSIQETFLQLRVVTRLDVLNTKLADVTKAFALTNNIKWQQAYDDLSIEFDSLVGEVSHSAALIDRETLANFELLTNKIKGTELLILFKTRNGDRQEAIKLFDTIYSAEQQEASMLLSDYIETKSSTVSNNIQSLLYALSESENVITVASIILIILIVVLLLVTLTAYVLRPLDFLVQTAETIESGNLNARAEIVHNDEIGNLAETFNTMTANLSGQIRKSDQLVREQNKTNGELVVANDQLRDLDRRKSEFISIVAHQLRTPLSGIKWTLATFLEGDIGALTGEQKNYLKKTYDSNERIIALVEDMLYADRIESGKNPLMLESANLTEIIESVLTDLYSKIRSKELKIIFNKDAKLPLINIDSRKIRAVLQNLLENAVKYTPQGGVVGVDIMQEDKVMTIKIKDNGIGIPKDQQQYLYTKFFRAKNAMRNVTDGTGLGLFIAKNVIDLHKGRLWCESEEGKGTTFFVSLNI